MQISDGGVVLSATDLNNFLACEHLTLLDLAAANGEIERPAAKSPQAEKLAELGAAHEREYLGRLEAEGRTIVTIARRREVEGYARAAAETEAAMAGGADVIYQATFFDGIWVGHADFLRRVDGARPGSRWGWTYEVEDTKLARSTRPYFLLQLAYYSQHVARVQGVAPEYAYVVLGDGSRHGFRVGDVAAYERAARRRFLARLVDEKPAYPLPVDHCGMCPWNSACERRRFEDDHLSGVAGITGLQRARLEAAGITTLAALGAAPPDAPPKPITASTFTKLTRQARLQAEQRTAKAAREPYPYKYELLREGTEEGRGFTRLPAPSPGDVFFDMEGDPYYELGTGLEYLFGATTPDGEFHPFWGCDRSERPARDRLAEKRAFESFIDFVMDRREADPYMHIYHYAPYEKTAMQKLSLRHATREAEVDILLREERLVDLYRVVRQTVAVGQPSYSIKKIEEFYGKRADDAGIKAGDDSILAFEAWLASRNDPEQRDDSILHDLERYNRYDCESTLGLRDWLLKLRGEAEKTFDVALPPYEGGAEEQPKITTSDRDPELKAALEAKLPEDFEPDGASLRDLELLPYFLARHLLDYHWREDKPVYWKFHDRCDQYAEDPSALEDEADAIVGLVPDGDPVPLKQSLEYHFTFPTQLHKLKVGEECFDLATKEKAGEITSLVEGDEISRLSLKRGKSLSGFPLPRAVTTRSIVQASTVRKALVRFAEELLGSGASTRYRAAYDLLVRRDPRVRGMRAGASLQPDVPDAAAIGNIADALEESYLFVQGPPGSGKTYAGARVIVDFIARGKRVGITANSHKAIHNLLDEVEKVATERGVAFAGLKKGKLGEESAYDGAFVRTTEGALDDAGALLVAGTAWAFGAEVMDATLDYLVIDEAGQVSLAAAIASATAARNVILLGDPLQLSQVSQTAHPGDVGASVLTHLLGRELRPVSPHRGILLAQSYRMHPAVCAFISELLYEGRLHSAPDRERQRIEGPGLAGAGLAFLPVAHSGNRQSSPEEAAVVAHQIAQMMRGTVTGVDGVERPISERDIMVVSPYNAQVRTLRHALSQHGLGAVEVGTVDKFQGREAYAVFYSTAASSANDAARGPAFAFDRQRFNVAVSRARALAVLVASPALLEHPITSIDGVYVANGVARFVEEADARRTAQSPPEPARV